MYQLKVGLLFILVLLSVEQRFECTKLTTDNVSYYLSKDASRPFYDQQLTDVDPVTLQSFSQSSLSFDSNLLKYLPENFFKYNDKYLYVSFGSNYIASVHPKVFQKLTNVRQINFCSNFLKEIDENLLKSNINLLDVFFDDNKIASIHPDAFATLSQLVNVNLERNELEIIEEEWFKHNPKVKSILLNNNRIKAIHPKAFISLVALNELHLSDNQLQTFDLALLSSTKVLSKLSLNQNQLMNIDYKMLKSNFPVLTTIAFDDNYLNCSYAASAIEFLFNERLSVMPTDAAVRGACIEDTRYAAIAKDRLSHSHLLDRLFEQDVNGEEFTTIRD